MGWMEELKGLGVNTDEGLERVMGDSSLYEMMLGMFISAVQENRIAPKDFDGSDLETVIKKVHMLKGTAGNLSLTPLFNSYQEMLALLRSNQTAKAKAEFEKMLPIQEQLIDCIKQHMEG